MAETIGKVYSTALFELCNEQGSLDRVFGDFTEFSELMSGEDCADYIKFLSSPLISGSEKAESLKAVFGDKIEGLLLDFLCLVTEKNRADRLEEIYAEFRRMYNDEKNILEVTAVTAVPLSAELRKRLTDKLGKTTGRSIVLTEQVDKSIIGGMIVRYGNTELDSSVKTRLDDLKAKITGTIA
ncbi:ATP synthase F1 subunit delta [Ruminococcus sp.]|uniref:ATP synthase F1 subunit delta n=1 Tax=Ruminococcus sp. TaxID=41978 RepID=UPI0025D7A66D|nr:ATP synthase F1 subunit delta [Ruminococcus sp.]MBQ8965733.1 ATP synthase F1 subunit delta [Ruminococcus sp.]